MRANIKYKQKQPKYLVGDIVEYHSPDNTILGSFEGVIYFRVEKVKMRFRGKKQIAYYLYAYKKNYPHYAWVLEKNIYRLIQRKQISIL